MANNLEAIPVSVAELFDSLIPLGLSCYPDRACDVGAKFLFDIQGEGGGTWVLDCSSLPPTCKRRESSEDLDLDVTIEISAEDLQLVLKDYRAGVDLFFQGKLGISGEMALAEKLGMFFDVTRRPPA